MLSGFWDLSHPPWHPPFYPTSVVVTADPLPDLQVESSLGVKLSEVPLFVVREEFYEK